MPDTLLLDEPYAGLDAGLRRPLTELVDAKEVPAVLAAHEPAEAQAFADKLERGVKLTGMVSGCRPSLAGWEADLAIGATTITCRLPERLAEVGGELVITAVDPPWFGPDGAAVAGPDGPSVPPCPSNPKQVGR